MDVQLIDAVYIKSTKGQQEIAERACGLPARVRRLLILIDGSKSTRMLAELLAGSDIDPALQELSRHGLIQPLSQPEPPAPPPPAAAEVIVSTATRQVQPAFDPLLLEQAKNLMIESARQFLGLMASQLITEIQNCNVDNCKQVIARWNMALRQSNKARDYADQYVDAVKTLIALE